MMNIEELIYSIMCIMFLLTIYIFSKSHTMNNLIIIEFIVVSSTILMFMTMNMLKMENYLIMYFLITMISESILGLSILIAMIRTHSNDFLKSIMIMKL